MNVNIFHKLRFLIEMITLFQFWFKYGTNLLFLWYENLLNIF